MKKLLAIALALALLITVAASVPVAAKGEIHVYEGGSIQYAIDHYADPGDTILVHKGTYNENVSIDKSLTIKAAGGKERPVVDGGAASAFVIEANGVTVKGFRATSTDVHVIHINPSVEDVMIHDNEVSGATDAAIMVYGSANTIKGNYVHHSHIGIRLDEVSNNQVLDNSIADVGFVGIWLWNSHDNMVVGNQVDATGAESCIQMNDESSGNTIVENELSNGAVGVALNTAGGNHVLENRIGGSHTGISVIADNNHILENSITNAGLWGISLVDANLNEVVENEVSRCDDAGIRIANGSYNVIRENRVFRSGEYDLYWDGFGTDNIWQENKYKTSNPDPLP